VKETLRHWKQKKEADKGRYFRHGGQKVTYKEVLKEGTKHE
jgi:hypothetical protein